VAIVALAACSGHKPYAFSGESQRAASPPPQMAIATGCAPVDEQPADHAFVPRSHPPRAHAQAVPPPHLDTLPRLVENGGCTPPGRSLEARGRPRFVPPVAAAPARRPVRRGPVAVSSPVAKASVAPGAALPSTEAKSARGATAGATRASPAQASPPAAASPPPASPVAVAPAPSDARRRSESASDQALTGAEQKKSPSEPVREPVAVEPFVPPEPCPPAPPPEPPHPTDSLTDWGVATYLSNDDTMSLSSAQRIIYAIDSFLPIPPNHVRRHELLNYFSFDTRPVGSGDDFSVLAGIAPKEGEPGVHTLALAVQGRRVERATRRNLALTVLVDRSGSMREQGRMAYVKRGLRRMTRELKPGDIVHLLTFNTAACVPLQGFVVGRDRLETLERAIDGIQPQGDTDLGTGLLRAYQVADAAYRRGYANRVLLITDALANTGETDPELLALVSRYYDRRQIRLSGIGVGREFNDRLLDRLTERGKGAYVFLGSEAEVDALFGSRFLSLVETIAHDTHFLLHLPPSLRMSVFYGEESSTVREEVQPIHYFAGTSQLFLADVMARRGRLREADMIMLGVDYRDAESGEKRVEEYGFRLGDIPKESRNVKKARLIVAFVDGLGWMASRVPDARRARAAPRGWSDDEAAWECERRGRRLVEMGRGIEDDPEVRRVQGLWTRTCERFEPPRGPRSSEPARPESWPGASPPR
jgi:Ca-activated chloride channel family protein